MNQKRLFLSLLLTTVIIATLKSQILSVNDQLYCVPAALGYNAQPAAYTASDDIITIYDNNFKQDRSFNIYGNFLRECYYIDYDNFSGPRDIVFLSQTFFNNDEKFEYVTYDESNFYVINEDGNTTMTLSHPTMTNISTTRFIKYGGHNYLIIRINTTQSGTQTIVYDVNNAQGISSLESNNISSSRLYDISGKSISNEEGLYIKNGQKFVR